MTQKDRLTHAIASYILDGDPIRLNEALAEYERLYGRDDASFALMHAYLGLLNMAEAAEKPEEKEGLIRKSKAVGAMLSERGHDFAESKAG